MNFFKVMRKCGKNDFKGGVGKIKTKNIFCHFFKCSLNFKAHALQSELNPSWPGEGGRCAPLEFFRRNFFFRPLFFYKTNLDNYYFYVVHTMENFQKHIFQPYLIFFNRRADPPPSQAFM